MLYEQKINLVHLMQAKFGMKNVIRSKDPIVDNGLKLERFFFTIKARITIHTFLK